MIHQYIADLAGYALQTGLMEEADFTWAVNSLCQALDLDTWEERPPRERPLEETLAGILDWAEAQALKNGDFEGFLQLVRESGRSSAMYLQNVIPTGQTVGQELMVTIALCECLLEGRGAVRVHGGGFGGTAQAFVPLDMLERFKEKTEAVLGQGSCHVVTIRPEGGVRLA